MGVWEPSANIKELEVGVKKNIIPQFSGMSLVTPEFIIQVCDINDVR